MKIEKILDNIIEWSFFIFVFSLPFSKALVEMSIAFAIFTWAIKIIFLKKQVSFLKYRSSMLVLFFFLVNTISVFLSIDPGHSFQALISKTFEYLFLFFVAFDFYSSEERIIKIFKVFVFSGFLVSVDGLFQFVFGFDFIRHYDMLHGGELVRACFGNPNMLAAWGAMVSFFLIGGACFFYQKKLSGFVFRLILFFALIFIFINILLTDSRAAWLAMLFAVVIFGIILSLGVKLKKSLLFLFVLIFIVVGLYFVLPDTVSLRFLSLMDLNSNSERIKLWGKAWFLLKESNFLGSGLNTFAMLTHQYKDYIAGVEYAHNSFLQMTVELGIAGLFAFSAIVVNFFMRSLKIIVRFREPLYIGLFMGILVFLIHSFFDNHLFSIQLSTLFWFSLGLINGYYLLLKDKTINNNSI